eukprot:1339975-Amphidinium_carterae.1
MAVAGYNHALGKAMGCVTEMDRIFVENVAPVNSDERSPLFIKYVEKYNSADPSCSTAEHAVGRLP